MSERRQAGGKSVHSAAGLRVKVAVEEYLPPMQTLERGYVDLISIDDDGDHYVLTCSST